MAPTAVSTVLQSVSTSKYSHISFICFVDTFFTVTIIRIEEMTIVSVKMPALPSSLGTTQQVQKQLDSYSKMQIRSGDMLSVAEHSVTGFRFFIPFILLVYSLKTSLL